jgi:hypothetical protein
VRVPSSTLRYVLLTTWADKFAAGKATADIATMRKVMDDVAIAGPAHTIHAVVAYPGRREMSVAMASRIHVAATKCTWIDIAWDDIFQAGREATTKIANETGPLVQPAQPVEKP